jgi:phage recombination protein Bet
VIQLVKATVCPGASPLELACFLYNAKRLGLDPMTRQIYFIKYDRTAPAEIVIGINGYRAQAESSGVYAGSDDAVFEYEDVGQPKGAPSMATVTVHKIVAGMKVDFTASVRWKEFYPGDGKAGEQYRKRPHNQLAIRAESHALRKGFPQQTERLEIQEAPVTWEQAAAADVDARNDPTKIGRDAKRYEEIFGDDDDEVDSNRARAASRKPRAASATTGASPAPASDDERAAAIVEQAHAAAAQRDENVDEIEAARQVEHEGLLM